MICILYLGAPQLSASEPLLQMNQCTIGYRPFVRPLEEIDVGFNRHIQLTENATATVNCDGQPVAVVTRLGIENEGEGVFPKACGWLILHFDKQLLPKGKSYVVTIPAGTVCIPDMPEETNSLVEIPFEVPETLGEAFFDLEQGATVDTSDRHCFNFYWRHETVGIGKPEFILYREGVAVRTYPADPSCGDWDLGCARPLFETGDKIKFENGVHYSLVLPAGSVCTFREDITNEEAVLNFVGSYTEPVEQIRYEWCSLFDNPKIEEIGEVSFRYNIPVIVVENSKMQLYTADGTTLVKEADMFLDTSINCFVVKADFGGIAIPEEGFTIVIPEGSIISDMGEIAVNPRHTITVGGSAGIKPVFVTDRSDVPIYDIQGRKVTQPVAGQIYIQANRKFRAQAQ